MSRLVMPQETAAVLKKHGLILKKRFGQNFLIDAHVLEKIVAAAGAGSGDTVLEIGPGIGTLTQALAETAGRVVAVEIDRDLVPVLRETLAAYPNVEIVNEDILKYDIAALAAQAGGRLKVAANLPYYITTPIIMRLLEDRIPAQSITVMIQKEVAERMAAGPGSKDYGALSLAVQYYAEPELVANVPPNCFMPRPAVSSVVIRLTLRTEPAVKTADPDRMFALIRAAFGQRRKTLTNSLANAGGLHLAKADVQRALAEMKLDENIRGEALNLAQFAELADLLPS